VTEGPALTKKTRVCRVVLTSAIGLLVCKPNGRLSTHAGYTCTHTSKALSQSICQSMSLLPSDPTCPHGCPDCLLLCSAGAHHTNV
jgi:hypothetical protein